MKTLLAVLFFLLINLNVQAQNLSKVFPATGIKKIKISTTKGSVFITTHSLTDKSIRTSVEKIRFDEKCQDVRVMNGTTLELSIESPNKLFNTAHCEGKLLVEVPAQTFFEVDVSTGSAEINVEKVNGHFDLQTATGNISINGETLKNLTVKTATGNMRAGFKKCEGRSDIHLMSATGDMALDLPGHCRIRVSHKSATGDLFNELGESEDYQVLISSKSASGQLTIKKSGK